MSHNGMASVKLTPEFEFKIMQENFRKCMGFSEQQYLLFQLFTLPFNVNHVSYKKNMSSGSRNSLPTDS